MAVLEAPNFLFNKPTVNTPRNPIKKTVYRSSFLALTIATLLWTRSSVQYRELSQLSTDENLKGLRQVDKFEFRLEDKAEKTTGPSPPKLAKPTFDWNRQSSTLEVFKVDDEDESQPNLENDDNAHGFSSSDTASLTNTDAEISRSAPKEGDEYQPQSPDNDVKKDGLRGSSRKEDNSDDSEVSSQSPSNSTSEPKLFDGEFSVLDEEKVPQIAWLMSFPNSGTTYTNKLIQGMTQTTTATNYGQEQSGYKTSIPISPTLRNGPFFRFPDGKYSKLVLTKTHCGAYCVRCTPSHYLMDAKRFESECRSGNKLVDGKSSSVKPEYGSEVPKKAVHILRNPLDNIVARLHMQRKNWENHKDHDDFLEIFTDDILGFRRWCRFLDVSGHNATMRSSHVDNTTKALFEVVPCAPEFHRYVQWHNLAIKVANDRLQIPVHTIFYEDYSTKYNETVAGLLGFLELEPVSEPPPFITGKVYREYFTEEEQYNIGQLIRHLATEESWALLRHYFDGILDDDKL